MRIDTNYVWDADLHTYNEERMTAHDPKAYKTPSRRHLLQQVVACTDGRRDLSNPSAVARQVRKMAADREVLQSPAMQALVEELHCIKNLKIYT